MKDHDTLTLNRNSWNALAAQYQAHTRISTDDVHYGCLAPGERELGLLGDVRDKRVIEIGCGGGQNSIALSKWGATCVGVDPSEAQLAYAHRLATQEGVGVRFVQGVAEDLGDFPDETFDIVLSSYAFDYVTDLEQAYQEVWRVLKPGGLFVFCLSHPWFQAVGWYLAGDPDCPEPMDYTSWPSIEEWDWTYEDGTAVRMRSHLRTLTHLVNGLIDAGFVLERIIEQNIVDVASLQPEELARYPYVNEFDPASQGYKIMRRLPHTLILKARKRG
ncbi:MAG TPA: SAM-dependent methyltransferase [Anaerolineae bacterium]|nr:SAM-dependent methyltransferase [Anaerolineae bacterium]